MARLALVLVAAGLIANLVFNMVMARMGYEYPHDSFLFRPNDRWADFFKLAFAYPGAPVHAPVSHWAFQPLVDLLKKGADEFRGTSINPDHLPPLPTLLAVLVRWAFGLFDPMVVFIVCSAATLIAYVSTLAEFAERQEDRLRWMALGLLSYPFWFAADRGHFFSVLCAITLIAAWLVVVQAFLSGVAAAQAGESGHIQYHGHAQQGHDRREAQTIDAPAECRAAIAIVGKIVDDDPKADSLGSSYARKPLFSREGANVELWQNGRKGRVLDQGYGAEGWIRLPGRVEEDTKVDLYRSQRRGGGLSGA